MKRVSRGFHICRTRMRQSNIRTIVQTRRVHWTRKFCAIGVCSVETSINSRLGTLARRLAKCRLWWMKLTVLSSPFRGFLGPCFLDPLLLAIFPCRFDLLIGLTRFEDGYLRIELFCNKAHYAVCCRCCRILLLETKWTVVPKDVIHITRFVQTLFISFQRLTGFS